MYSMLAMYYRQARTHLILRIIMIIYFATKYYVDSSLHYSHDELMYSAWLLAILAK